MPLADWERAVRAVRPLRLRDRVRRMLFGDLFRRSASAARRARGRAAARPRRAIRGWSMFSSLSKRSNVPGMRSGFRRGRRGRYPEALPALSHLSGLRDEPARSRPRASPRGTTRRTSSRIAGSTARSSRPRSSILRPHVDVEMPDAAFYLWLHTPISDPSSRAGSTKPQAVSVLPGSYLARESRRRQSGDGSRAHRARVLDRGMRRIRAAHPRFLSSRSR